MSLWNDGGPDRPYDWIASPAPRAIDRPPEPEPADPPAAGHGHGALVFAAAFATVMGAAFAVAVLSGALP
jgi:hypothetical protein